MTRDQVERYLDYCSEMLSLVGKTAALCAEESRDSVILETVSTIENLTVGLSRKIWQKISNLPPGEPAKRPGGKPTSRASPGRLDPTDWSHDHEDLARCRPPRRRRPLRRLHPRDRLPRSTARRPATAAPGCSAATTATRPSSSRSRSGSRGEAIVAFAGDDIEAAVLYPEDAAYLLGESSITHHDVADVVTPEV